jgi:hypothetical protein
MSNDYRAYDNSDYSVKFAFSGVNNDNNYPNEYAMQADNCATTVVVQESNDLTTVITPSFCIPVIETIS